MRNFVLTTSAVFLFAQAATEPTAVAQPATVQTGAWADKLFGGVTHHDFGIVARGAQLKHSFKMTNIYKEPLEIQDWQNIRVSCGRCSSAKASVKVLQPGESGTIDVFMDARQFAGQQKSITVYVTVGPKFVSTATLTVTANARLDVAFTPNELEFGNVPRGQTPTKYVDVEYFGVGDWEVKEIVKSASAPFELKVEPLPSNRRGYRILATLKPDGANGLFKQEILLKTNDVSSPTLTFNITGNIQSALTVSPASLAVNGLKVGESTTKKVVIRAERPFRILSIDGQGDGVSVEIPDREDTTMILSIKIEPTKEGMLRKQLTIRTDVDKETATVTVQGDVAP
jgi:hypothetical protein